MVGYSGTPLHKKLGIKSGFFVYLKNTPPDYFDLLGDYPIEVNFVDSLANQVDVIHLFTNNFSELAEFLNEFQNCIKSDGMIWVSWYKKAAKLRTEITEDLIREVALNLKLVDIKVCAIDEKWSALKLVIRRENRNLK